MAQNPYATWTPTGVKSEQAQGQGHFSANVHSSGASSRRTGSGDQLPDAFAFSGAFHQVCGPTVNSIMRSWTDLYVIKNEPYARGATRPQSGSSTSSLSGAMGEPPLSPHSQISGHTPPSGMVWSSSPTSTTMPEGAYVVVPDDDSAMSSYLATPLSPNPSSAFALQQQQYSVPIYSNNPEPLTTDVH